MNCQLCNSTITSISKQGIEVFACEKCQGFWIKKGDLNTLIKHKAGDIEFSSIDHHIHKDTHGIMKCTFCDDRTMIKINFIEDNTFEVDIPKIKIFFCKKNVIY